MAKKKRKIRIKEFVKSFQDDIKNGFSSAVYLPLLPFLPVMRRALQKSGYNSSGDLQEVSERFFHEYIRNLNYDYKHVKALKASGAGHSFDALTVAQIAQEILPVIRQLIEMFKNGDKADREALRESDDASEVFEKDSVEPEKKDSDVSDNSAFKQYLPILLGLLLAGFLLSQKGGKS